MNEKCKIYRKIYRIEKIVEQKIIESNYLNRLIVEHKVIDNDCVMMGCRVTYTVPEIIIPIFLFFVFK